MTYDWQGHALSVGQVEVLMDNHSYPMWFRGEQLVIDSEVEEAP